MLDKSRQFYWVAGTTVLGKTASLHVQRRVRRRMSTKTWRSCLPQGRAREISAALRISGHEAERRGRWEGKNLPPWHYLICGDRQEVHRRYRSVRHFALSEADGHAIDDHLLYRLEDILGEGDQEP